jgi:hypothetical protein
MTPTMLGGVCRRGNGLIAAARYPVATCVRVDLEQAHAHTTHILSRYLAFLSHPVNNYLQDSVFTYLPLSASTWPGSPIVVTGTVNIAELVYALRFPIHARQQQRGVSVCPSP